MISPMTMLNQMEFSSRVASAERDGNRYKLVGRTGGSPLFEVHNAQVEEFKSAILDNAISVGSKLQSILSQMPSTSVLEIAEQRRGPLDNPDKTYFRIYINVADARSLAFSIKP